MLKGMCYSHFGDEDHNGIFLKIASYKVYPISQWEKIMVTVFGQYQRECDINSGLVFGVTH